MKISSFELEEFLHKINKVLSFRGTKVEFAARRTPEDGGYEVRFTQEFLDDLKALLNDDIYYAFEYTLLDQEFYGQHYKEEEKYKILPECEVMHDYMRLLCEGPRIKVHHFRKIRVPIYDKEDETFEIRKTIDADILYRMMTAADKDSIEYHGEYRRQPISEFILGG